ncbi:uncharacterized protein TNCV_697651 [Trichonephila clavipes]|nr:uncharacterized protein TNCV_697651 [Trichonephila clavipes]
MSSAFDRVWRQKLITLVHQHGIRGNALIWINDFLRNRKVRVQCNGCLSKSRKILTEYASSIRAHASKTTLEKLDSVQARASKVIVEVVSSANNLKFVKECDLGSLEKRRKYNSIKFTNKESLFPAGLPKNTKILTSLLQPYTKNGSSDETFLNGGSGVFMTTPSDSNYQREIGAGELDKVYFLQWLPAHIDITVIENVDKLAKEARNLNNDNFVSITLLDANAVENFKLRKNSIPLRHQICNISGDRLITKTIARLRTGNYRGMKFDRDGRRSYRNCDNCLDTELTSAYIFDCPAILASLQAIGVLSSSINL